MYMVFSGNEGDEEAYLNYIKKTGGRYDSQQERRYGGKQAVFTPPDRGCVKENEFKRLFYGELYLRTRFQTSTAFILVDNGGRIKKNLLQITMRTEGEIFSLYHNWRAI
jgi:hypothetical protein